MKEAKNELLQFVGGVIMLVVVVRVDARLASAINALRLPQVWFICTPFELVYRPDMSALAALLLGQFWHGSSISYFDIPIGT